MEEIVMEGVGEILIQASKDVKKEHKKEIRENTVRFYLFAVGFAMNNCPYMSIVSLQSSINIEENLGTVTLGVAYTVSSLFILFFAPSIIQRFGCKNCIIAGEIMLILYLVANFYPAFYTMIPAAIFNGISDALTWTVQPMYFVHFGEIRGSYSSQKSDVFVRKYTGIFFGIFNFGNICGQTINYLVLYGINSGYSDYNSSESMIDDNDNISTFGDVPPYEHCGANDCQDPNITSSKKSHYEPESTLSIYVLIGAYCFISLCGLIIHIRYLPDVRTSNSTSTKKQDDENSNFREPDIKMKEKTQQKDTPPSLKETILATLSHSVDKRQLLLTPLLLYYGMLLTFIMSELTRAYTSCILGVEKVGLAMVTFGAVDVAFSSISGTLLRILGRNRILIALFILDVLNYILCLTWTPSIDNSWVIYLIFSVFGITDALWNTNAVGVHAEYFPDNQEIAFSYLNLHTTAGLAIGFFFSSLFCVSSRIYIQLSMLCLSVIGYGIARYIQIHG